LKYLHKGLFRAAVLINGIVAQAPENMTEKATSDLAQVWQVAVEEYEKATGQSLRMGMFNGMEDVLNRTEEIFMNFKHFREDKSKLAKVRCALKNNMCLIQNIINTVQNVGNAASVCLGIESTVVRNRHSTIY
jgi:hypothetical protein